MATRQIPWARIVAEGVAIVVSILLAFAIQAWWDGVQDREAEQAALRALRADFLASQGGLATAIRVLENAQANFATFQSSKPGDLSLLAPDSAERLSTSLEIALTYDPVTSSLDALLNDGRIDLLRDDRLRGALAEWVRALDDIEENEAYLRSTSMIVRRAMQRHGGPFFFPRMSADALAFLPRVDGATLAELRRDEEFVGDVRTHHYGMAGYLAELKPLDSRITDLLALIDANLD